MEKRNKTLKFDYDAGKIYIDEKTYIESGSDLIEKGTYSFDSQKATLTINKVKWLTSAEVALDLTNQKDENYSLNLQIENECAFCVHSSGSNAVAVYFNGKDLTIHTSTYGHLYAETRSSDNRVIEQTWGILCRGQLKISDGTIKVNAQFGKRNYGICASGNLDIYGGRVTSCAFGWPIDPIESCAFKSEDGRILIDGSVTEAIGRTAAICGKVSLGSTFVNMYRLWSLEGFAPPWDPSAVNYGAVEAESVKSGNFKDINGKTYLKFFPKGKEIATTWTGQDDSIYLYHKHKAGMGVPIFIMPVHFSVDDLVEGGKYQAASKWAADLILNAETFEDITEYLDIYIYLKGDTISPVPQIGYIDRFFECDDRMRNIIMQTLGEDALPKARLIYLGNCDNAGQVERHEDKKTGAYLSWGINAKSGKPWEPNPEYWVIHEFSGHAFGGFADEYKTTPMRDSKPHVEAPNLYISPTKPDVESVPWKSFVGFKEGEESPCEIYGYDNYNAWRPSKDCFMNSNPNMYVPMYYKWVIYEKLMNYAGTPKTLEDFCKLKKISLLPFNVAYTAHVKTLGWLPYAEDGQTAGTTGESRRLEAVKIKLVNCSIPGAGIKYRVHVRSKGWLPYVHDDQVVGTTGESRRAEAIQIELVGLPDYSVVYRVHMKTKGWSDWVCDGAVAGTTGESRRIEAIEVYIKKNE